MRRTTRAAVAWLTLGLATGMGTVDASEIQAGAYLQLDTAAVVTFSSGTCDQPNGVDISGGTASVSSVVNPAACNGATATATASGATLGGLSVSSSASGENDGDVIQVSAYAGEWDWGIISVPGDGFTQITLDDTLQSTVSHSAGASYILQWFEGPPADPALYSPTYCSPTSISCIFEIADEGEISGGTACSTGGGICFPDDGETHTYVTTPDNLTVQNGDVIGIYQDLLLETTLGTDYDGPASATLEDPLELTLPQGVTITWIEDDGYVVTNEEPANAVPEPGSLALFGAGFGLIMLEQRRHRLRCFTARAEDVGSAQRGTAH